MALPGVEITITLDSIDADADGNDTQSKQPQQVEPRGAQKERENQQLRAQGQAETEQEQVQGQSGSARPKLLPFLSEIRNRGPARQTGRFPHVCSVIFRLQSHASAAHVSSSSRIICQFIIAVYLQN